MRTERISFRIDLVVDQRFDEIPKEAVDRDQIRQAPICHLMRQGMNSSKKQELMQKPFSKEGRTFTLISDQSKKKKIIREQGDVEAFELLELRLSLIMTQVRDFIKDKGTCYRVFLRMQIKLSKISETFW